MSLSAGGIGIRVDVVATIIRTQPSWQLLRNGHRGVERLRYDTAPHETRTSLEAFVPRIDARRLTDIVEVDFGAV